ncbi:MAG TPA: type II secretion system F family protein, partial [Burkholderiaceae bacterium]|nr:type II secretion system F family protein [Burkholderiaceae bacterium]
MTSLHLFYLALVFVAASCGCYALASLLGGNPVRRRLRSDGDRDADRRRGGDWTEPALAFAKPLARLAQSSKRDDDSIRLQLVRAGLRHPAAPVLFYGLKAGLAIGFALVVLLLISLGGYRPSGFGLLLALLIAATLGFYAPNIALGWLKSRRERELFEAFPDAVDLMIVCVEAGLSLDVAISRAAADMRLRSEAMADELSLVSVELRIGATRERALRNFAHRTGIDEIAG